MAMTEKEHIVKAFDAELKSLLSNMLDMAGAVRGQLAALSTALAGLNREEAEKVVERDALINLWEKELDAFMESLISKRQPQAVDLRLLLGCWRMTNDFERMGDEVRNAAKGICRLANPVVGQAGEALTELVSVLERLKGMADKMNAALLSMDAKAARHLVEERDLVSEQVHDALTATVSRMKMNAVTLDDGLEFIRINRALERVAAHMQNIGEAIIFIVEGLDIRHEKIAHEEDSDDDDEAD